MFGLGQGWGRGGGSPELFLRSWRLSCLGANSSSGSQSSLDPSDLFYLLLLSSICMCLWDQGSSARKMSKMGALVCRYLCLSLEFILNHLHQNKFGLSGTILLPHAANRSICSSSSFRHEFGTDAFLFFSLLQLLRVSPESRRRAGSTGRWMQVKLRFYQLTPMSHSPRKTHTTGSECLYYAPRRNRTTTYMRNYHLRSGTCLHSNIWGIFSYYCDLFLNDSIFPS